MSQRLSLTTDEELKVTRSELLKKLQETQALSEKFVALAEKSKKENTSEIISDLSPRNNLGMARHFFNETRTFKYLLDPQPEIVPEEKKDQEAYESALKELADNKPLRDVLEHVHKLSSFLRVGKNIGKYKDEKASDDVEVSMATFNIACLPEYDIFGNPVIQVNKDFLRPDMVRAKEAIELLTDFFKHIRELDIFFFEEAFDKEVRKLLKGEFAKLGYACIGDEGEKFLNAGSGLLGFYKKETLSVGHTSFHPYARKRVGSETLANKGILRAEFIFQKKYALTTISTHELTGGGINSSAKDNAIYGTTSEVRGTESQIMHGLPRHWIDHPLKDASTGEVLPHLGILFAADMNQTLSRPYQHRGLSSGKSFNGSEDKTYEGFEQDDEKYSGIRNLTAPLFSVEKGNWPIPRNSISVYGDKSDRESGPKPIDILREKKAIEDNLATGSTFSTKLLAENKDKGAQITLQTTEHHLIDLLAVESDQSKLNNFESYVVSSMHKSSGKAISDHALLFAVARLQPMPELKSKKVFRPVSEKLKSVESKAVGQSSFFGGLFKYLWGGGEEVVVSAASSVISAKTGI